MSKKNNSANTPHVKLVVGQTFTPFGTDNIGTVERIDGDAVTYHYESDRHRKFTMRVRDIARIAKIGPKPAPPVQPKMYTAPPGNIPVNGSGAV